jgi:hypothetical protein
MNVLLQIYNYMVNFNTIKQMSTKLIFIADIFTT